MSKADLYARDISGAEWAKSSFSENETDMCVEVAFLGGGAVALRDSTSCSRPDLRFTRGEWSAFTAGVRRGEFDS
ncbi:MAG: DUF397 domain-containing protein [Pseudonocardiaceae bacterium]